MHDFCVFILSHGRPDRVKTYHTLLRAGYTGKIFIVIDDEDERAPEYFTRYGDQVVQFSKKKEAECLDEGDNFNKRNAIIYARSACFHIAAKLGFRFFIQLDDDYYSFVYRVTKNGVAVKRRMNDVFAVLLEFYKSIPATTIAMSQGGDHMGGHARLALTRKAMNSFICSTDRPFRFVGRVNEDVNTYVTEGRAGKLFFTVLPIQLDQLNTQSNAGGMTTLYESSGTYLKSFYSVMYAPSCVKIGYLKDPRYKNGRIHHMINWNHTAPKIIAERYKRGP